MNETGPNEPDSTQSQHVFAGQPCPSVVGRCPACQSRDSLFLSPGGRVTCSYLDCSDPGAAGKALVRPQLSGDKPPLDLPKRPPPVEPDDYPDEHRRDGRIKIATEKVVYGDLDGPDSALLPDLLKLHLGVRLAAFDDANPDSTAAFGEVVEYCVEQIKIEARDQVLKRGYQSKYPGGGAALFVWHPGNRAAEAIIEALRDAEKLGSVETTGMLGAGRLASSRFHVPSKFDHSEHSG